MEREFQVSGRGDGERYEEERDGLTKERRLKKKVNGVKK